MKLCYKGIWVFLLLAGGAFGQVPFSEKNISLEEVQVKPRKPKVWVQKGRAPLLPILHHSTRFYDLAGRKIDPPTYLNKVEPVSSKHVQVTSIDTKLESFDNDSFNVFFFVMQIQGTDTLITRKMILGHSIKRKKL